MEQQEQHFQSDSGTPVNTDETSAADQVVHDATQVQIRPAPTLDTILDQATDENVSDEEQEVELEEAIDEEDTTTDTEDQDDDTEDSLMVADRIEAQAVADMNDLQFGTQQCYICTDDVCYSKVLQLGCEEHWICHDCIADPFEQAIQQESCYPPKCCDGTGPLRIEDFEHLFATSHPDLIARYDGKLQEYHMDKRFRRYCGSTDCKTFLGPDSYEQDEEHNLTTADCPTCNRTTCVFCTKLIFKGTSHECESKVVKLNEDYSEEARFKYCPFCERPGLLEEGCNHVVCECKEEWCFICIRKWNGGYDHEECGQYNDPVYDSEGYDGNGYHRDTGVDRQGFNRDGFNVAGFDRDGNKVTDFARLERDRLHAPAPRPAGFLDLDDENFEETAMIMFISEREAGIVHETDNFEDLLAIRFPGFHGGNQFRGRGGARGRGRGAVQGGWAAPANNAFAGGLGRGRGGVRGGARGGRGGFFRGGNRGGHAAPPHFGDHENRDDDNDLIGDDNSDPNVENGGLDADHVNVGLGWAAAEEDIHNDTNNESHLDAEADSDGPQAPTAAQIQCQHNWDLANPGNLCRACTLTCEEYAMVCTTCNVESCGDCSQNFAGNALLNWPGAGVVGGAEGEDQNDAGPADAGEW